MKDQEFDEIEAIHYKKNYLFIVTDKISQICDGEKMTGQLVIRDNRIVILGPKLITNTPNHKDQPTTKEVV